MITVLAPVRSVLGAMAISFLFGLTVPALAQKQPDSVNPSADAVTEQRLLQEFGRVQGRISIPDKRESVLIHPAGRDWRQFHEVWLRWIGAIVILGIVLLLTAFYLWRGTVRLESGSSGRKLVRFTAFERFVHWMTAVSFNTLAITGLNITFGKPLLLPLIGNETFSAWSQWAKYAHNYVSFPFVIGLVFIFLMWLPGNIPNRVDLEWLKRGGGMLWPDHPPAFRFNAGQKAIYWLVVIAGMGAAISGYLLMFPFYGTGIDTMESAEMAHGIIAMLFTALILAHIYIGTIGMEGAFEAMGTGSVDRNWAKEHHSLWLEEEQAHTEPAGSQPQQTATPAE
jgi:formate dehydrogenase subunit gamma